MEEEEVEEEECKREEEEEEMEEDEIGTTMQSSVAMQQSCSHGPGQLFLYSELGGGGRGGGGDHNCNEVFHSNAAELYLWAMAIVFFQ